MKLLEGKFKPGDMVFVNADDGREGRVVARAGSGGGELRALHRRGTQEHEEHPLCPRACVLFKARNTAGSTSPLCGSSPAATATRPAARSSSGRSDR